MRKLHHYAGRSNGYYVHSPEEGAPSPLFAGDTPNCPVTDPYRHCRGYHARCPWDPRGHGLHEDSWYASYHRLIHAGASGGGLRDPWILTPPRRWSRFCYRSYPGCWTCWSGNTEHDTVCGAGECVGDHDRSLSNHRAY